jgi:integrase
MLQRAVVHGALPNNPVAFVRKPSQKRRRVVRPLHPKQVEQMRQWLIDHDRESDAVLISVLAYAGLRPGEALALIWDDVLEGSISVTKAASLGQERPTKTLDHRVVTAVAPLERDLEKLRESSANPSADSLVFPAPDGRMWTENVYRNWRRRWFKMAARAAELNGVRPYDLRHSFASLLLAEGRNPVEVAEQMGHAPTMTLDTYGHVISRLRARDMGPVSVEALINQARYEPEEEPEISVQDLYSMGAV